MNENCYFYFFNNYFSSLTNRKKCAKFYYVIFLYIFYMRNLFKNINLLPAFFLCVYPVLLVIFTIVFLQYNDYKTSYLILGVVTYYIANISIGVGMHRLWSHGAYRTKTWVECILAVLTAGTLQGPILGWCSDHFKHHTYTDEERDPHSPQKYHGGIKGFLWSHVGWMMVGELSYKNIDRITLKKLGKNKVVMWQYHNYWILAVSMNLVLPLAIGFALYGTLVGAVGAFLFMGVGRALQQQMTFCVNSLCHFVGKRTYYAGTARDIWWMFIFLLGENWHNFHHAFARDYRNGMKWYQLDIHKWIIAGMEKLGLAWDLVRTPEERINAKINETEKSIIETYNKKLEAALARTGEIATSARKQLEAYESAARNMKDSAAVKLRELERLAEQLRAKLRDAMENCDQLCDKSIKIIQKRLGRLEKYAARLGVMASA